MPIYHLSIKTVSRAHGRSAVGAAAYRAGQRLQDERLGCTFDYRRKAGVQHRELVLPKNAPAWASCREKLWNEAEKSEGRKNSTVAREFEIALPTELALEQRRNLALQFARELSLRHTCAVDVALHAPGKGGDIRNEHAHILTTTRRLSAAGFTEKCRELDDQKSGEVVYWRERWAQLVNMALAANSQVARVDHRSLAEQGIDRDPTLHDGPKKTAIARRLALRHQGDDEPKRPSLVQARAAKQLATMRARLETSDLSRFNKTEITAHNNRGKTSETVNTPVGP